MRAPSLLHPPTPGCCGGSAGTLPGADPKVRPQPVPVRSQPAAGDQCPRCPYSISVHVYRGEWIGCPADEAEAVARWGAQ